jgi:hypothetical protein
MARWRRRIGSAIAVAALLATPSMLSACLALCVPDAAGHAAMHAGHGSHSTGADATAHAGRHAGHPATARADAAIAGDGSRLSGAAHDCCPDDAGVVLLAGASGRSEAAPLPALAPPARLVAATLLASIDGRRVLRRPIAPPSPPSSPLVLRI